MAGDGGLNPRPLNAPPSGQPAIGVQPGVSNGVFLGRLVVVFGPTGTVSGAFVYTPGTKPQLGNPPVLSMTESSSDPYGNPVMAGFTAYGSGVPGGTLSSVEINSSAPFPLVKFSTGASTEARPTELVANVFNPNTVNERVSWAVIGPESTVTPQDFVSIQLIAASPSAAGISTGFLQYSGAANNTEMLAWGGSGLIRYTVGGGMAGGVPLNRADTGSRTANTAALVPLTFGYPIPANDPIVNGQNNTTYRIIAWGTGTQSAPGNNATFTFTAFGVSIFTSPLLGVAGAGTTFTWKFEGWIVVSTLGAAGNGVVGGKWFIQDSGGAVGQFLLTGTPTINTTVASDMEFDWTWAGVAGGPSITCIGSRFLRENT